MDDSEGNQDGRHTLGEDEPRIKRKKLTKNAKDNSKRLIVVLDNAHFVSHWIDKTSDKYELLTEDHIKPNELTNKTKFKGKYNQYLKDMHKFRPDLVHQCLLMLFDSPLNHAELLQVYIRTHDDKLIQIHRETRMPRTYKRFSHLMANFLVAGTLPQVTTKDGPINLMRILEGSIDTQLPPCSDKFKIVSYDEETPIIELTEIVQRDVPVVVFIDSIPVTMNIEQVDLSRPVNINVNKKSKSKTDKDIKVCCINQYPLTPTHVCVKVATAIEKYLNIT